MILLMKSFWLFDIINILLNRDESNNMKKELIDIYEILTHSNKLI